MAGSNPDSSATTVSEGQQQETQTFAFIAMTCLFFFWGFITVLNDILIPFLKESFDLNYTQAMLVQFCFFGAYFIVSPFAGRLIDKVGFQMGIVIGLLTTALGCILFYPSADLHIYGLFLFAFFVLASGITILQVAANPYVAALGPEKTAASRLNLAQAANSLGTTVGPFVGTMLILGVVAADASAVQMPYLMIAAVLVAAALLFRNISLPKLAHLETSDDTAGDSVWNHRSLVLGALAIFMYVGGEVSIGSFLVNYFDDMNLAVIIAENQTMMNIANTIASTFNKTFSNSDPKSLLGIFIIFYWGGAMIGRFIGAYLTKIMSPGRVLSIFALLAIALIAISINTVGLLSMWSILAVGLFNSIMFPTIFTLTLEGLGDLKAQASGLLCMAIVGGAIIPFAFGSLIDGFGFKTAFILTMICYGYILYYGMIKTSKTIK